MADDIEDPDDSSESEDSPESGDETSSGERDPEKGEKGDEKKEEEEDNRKIKSGYGKEWKDQQSLGQSEWTYTKKEGWEKEKPEAAEKGPERKITLWQYTPPWGDADKNRGYRGGVEKWGDQTKDDEKGKFFTSQGELGQGYHEWGATSEGSIDLNKKELNLTVIDLKGKISLDHAEQSAKFKLGAWVASLFQTSKEPEASEPPAQSGTAGMGALMAARVGDLTGHGSPLVPGIGSANVIIGNMPAWRTAMDFHACPVVKGIIPDVGGVVMVGSPTVLINFMMACRISDMVVEVPGGPNPIAMGCPTVFIGGGGGGGGAAGGGGGAAGGEKKEEGEGVVVEGKAVGDIWTAEGEANLGVVVNKEKVMAGGKISALASVFKGSIEGGLTIPLWGKHSITFGGEASGFAAGIGGEAHGDIGWTKEKGYHMSAGLKGALGFGGGAGFSIGFK